MRRWQRIAVRAGRDTEMFGLRTAGRVLHRDEPRRAPDRGMRILAHVPCFPPARRAGSEVSIAATLALLSALGNDVRVLVDDEGITGEPAGLGVIARPNRRDVRDHYRWCDVVLTQLSSRNRAMRLAALARRPVVHLLHMGSIDRATCLGEPDLLVFNSNWLQRSTAWTGSSTVLHPPIVPDTVRTTPGDAVTLVNLNPAKGVDVFFALARARPSFQFLGVTGEWGHQQIPRDRPTNVTLMDSVTDMREVFGRTRVVLMPSAQETYGRVGLEAACSGIPTVAAELEGLREALGAAAVYADRSDIAAWLNELDRLADPGYYGERSAAARRRADELDPRADVAAFERRLALVVDRVQARRP